MFTQDNLLHIFSKYADFSGRAKRAEFWSFILFSILVQIIVPIINYHYSILALLLLICPSVAVTTRRLHDINRSGWWQLIALVPIVGLVIFYWGLKKGDDGPNMYGPA